MTSTDVYAIFCFLKCLTHLFGCEFGSAYAGILKRFLMDANLYQPYYGGWFLLFSLVF